MISYKNALTIMEEIGQSQKCASETILLSESVGRILSETVYSPEAVPSFSNSAMDGFLVSTVDTFGATTLHPIRIPVCGLIAAGDINAFKKAGEQKTQGAIEIMTGAPIPAGRYDAVIRIEDVAVERNTEGCAQFIEVSRPSKSGDNIRLKGTDFEVGQEVLREGTRISPEHILACASLGLVKLKVKRRPRVVILSTGSELVPPETEALEPGMIRNSTGPFLLAALKNMGADAQCTGVITDDPIRYRSLLKSALEKGADIVISTGAVSMGKYDFVPEVLSEMGGVTHFHKSAIRPGKPILFAEIGQPSARTAFFGLPGNPVSTAVGLRFFVEPYFRTMLGLPREQPIQATLSKSVSKPEGLRCFYKGQAKVSSSGIEVLALKSQASYVVSTFVATNCWVVLEEEGALMAAASHVKLYPLQNAFERGVIE